MNKKIIYTLSTAFLLGSLAACNTDQGAMEDNTRYNDTARPIGYYSNENIDEENGNAYLPERDNDGPITEMLDRTGAENNRNNNRNKGFNVTDNRYNNNGVFGRNVTNKQNEAHPQNKGTLGTLDDGVIDDRDNRTRGNNRTGITARGEYGQYANRNELADYGNNKGMNNPTRPYAVRDNGLARDNQYSRNDYNYHGQMATRDNNKRASYYNNYDGRLADQISNRVQNIPTVDDVRTIVSGNQVLIALDTKDHDGKEVKSKVRQEVERMTNGKNVRIVTDPAIFQRAQNIDNNLQDGGPTTEIDEDVRDMFREIGNEVDDFVRTPFRDTK
ncbi:YhcN/YlaJ family sporulation lipoprotein [Bacillus salitolerans]|uniref:YhcN/YlaJ family sporulation lipoprotein n=1 Tax=Bacillus salitolerans TaxID=1437434 RepID=A0ABW4LLJ1_9BACI